MNKIQLLLLLMLAFCMACSESDSASASEVVEDTPDLAEDSRFDDWQPETDERKLEELEDDEIDEFCSRVEGLDSVMCDDRDGGGIQEFGPLPGPDECRRQLDSQKDNPASSCRRVDDLAEKWLGQPCERLYADPRCPEHIDCSRLTVEECGTIGGEYCRGRGGFTLDPERECLEWKGAYCMGADVNCNNSTEVALSPEGACYFFSSGCYERADGWDFEVGVSECSRSEYELCPQPDPDLPSRDDCDSSYCGQSCDSWLDCETTDGDTAPACSPAEGGGKECFQAWCHPPRGSSDADSCNLSFRCLDDSEVLLDCTIEDSVYTCECTRSNGEVVRFETMVNVCEPVVSKEVDTLNQECGVRIPSREQI